MEVRGAPAIGCAGGVRGGAGLARAGFGDDPARGAARHRRDAAHGREPGRGAAPDGERHRQRARSARGGAGDLGPRISPPAAPSAPTARRCCPTRDGAHPLQRRRARDRRLRHRAGRDPRRRRRRQAPARAVRRDPPLPAGRAPDRLGAAAQDGIACEVIVDCAAAHFLSRGEIAAVIVGADRIARNGDGANKIGTLAWPRLLRFGVPFFVAAPATTLDPAWPTGAASPSRSAPPTRSASGRRRGSGRRPGAQPGLRRHPRPPRDRHRHRGRRPPRAVRVLTQAPNPLTNAGVLSRLPRSPGGSSFHVRRHRVGWKTISRRRRGDPARREARGSRRHQGHVRSAALRRRRRQGRRWAAPPWPA